MKNETLTLRQIKKPNSTAFKSLWKVYKKSFPANEQRPLWQQVQLISNPNYQLFGALQKKQLIGLMGVWGLSDFLFIEHMAIVPRKRNQGLGSRMLKQLLAKKVSKAILEVDPPGTSGSDRRIRFYEKAGFFLNRGNYFQPSYHPPKLPVKMRLMSYPKKLSKKRFEKIRNKIHAIVYGRSKPLLRAG